MRHRGKWNQKDVGPVRRIARGVVFVLLLPVMLVVGIFMLPFLLIARLFGFRPGQHFGPGGCGGRRGCGRGADTGENVGTTDTTNQV